MRKFRNSLQFAIEGLKKVHQNQRNFRIQTYFGLFALLLAFFLDLTGQQLLWISFAVMIVLIMESINTIIETLLDFLHPEYNEIVGLIKDISAAVVLIAAVFAVVIGCIIFGEAIFNLNPKYGIIIAIIFIIFIKAFSFKGGSDDESN